MALQCLWRTFEVSERKLEGLGSLSPVSMSMGLPALYKGAALLAAFLWESRALPSPFTLGSAAICQQQQRILAPRCCFEDGEGRRATSPRALLKAAFSPCPNYTGEKDLALCVVLVLYSGGLDTSAG